MGELTKPQKLLEFKLHPNGISGTQAKLEFDNGYGVSVVTGNFFYTNDDEPYELAVTVGDRCVYDTGITEDVLGYLTMDQVNQYINEVKNLPKRT